MFDHVIRVASGEVLARAEETKHREFEIWGEQSVSLCRAPFGMTCAGCAVRGASGAVRRVRRVRAMKTVHDS